MTKPTDTWLSQRLHEGASTLAVPPDLTDEVVGQAIKLQPRSTRIHSVMQIAAAVAVMAVVVVGVNVLRSDNPSTSIPAAAPTPVGTAGPVTDTASALLGTWELVAWDGEPVRPTREMPNGPLVTFNTDGTWSRWNVCDDLDGTYRVGPGGAFESTTNGTDLGLCGGVQPFPVPAEGAVRVSVRDDVAIFFDTEGQKVAKYRRPGAGFAAEARLVTRLGDPVLSLSTYGSGSCPTRIESISVEAANQLVVNLADSSSQVCTADIKRSTDVVGIPGGLNLSAPITARLMGANPPIITLLVNSSAIVGEPRLVKAQDWDGTSVRSARLAGILGVNDQGCITVGDTVVMWPNTYLLATDRADTWAIVTTDEGYGSGYGTVLGTEGQQVTLVGNMTTLDASPGPPPPATHSECLVDDYWTGVIEGQPGD